MLKVERGCLHQFNLEIDLCKTFAEVIKKLCTAENLSSSSEVFLKCHLIPLDKNSGLRLIRAAEVLQQIVSKEIATHARGDILTSVGSLQVLTGH